MNRGASAAAAGAEDVASRATMRQPPTIHRLHSLPLTLQRVVATKAMMILKNQPPSRTVNRRLKALKAQASGGLAAVAAVVDAAGAAVARTASPKLVLLRP